MLFSNTGTSEHFRKKSGRWTVFQRNVKKTYNHVNDIFFKILKMRLEMEEGMHRPAELSEDISHHCPKVSSKNLIEMYGYLFTFCTAFNKQKLCSYTLYARIYCLLIYLCAIQKIQKYLTLFYISSFIIHCLCNEMNSWYIYLYIIEKSNLGI